MKKTILYKINFSKKDRKILIENFKKEKQYLLEFDGGQEYFERCKKDPNLPVYLVGLIQKGDAPNRNGRLYPFHILKKECDRYLREEVKDGQSYGELDHPSDNQVPELKNSAFTIEDIWFKGTEVWGRIKLLNAFMGPDSPGMKARGIILNGKTLGISSRALGSTYSDQNGYDVVEDDLEIICWDLVSRESTYGANLKLAENKKLKKQSVLTERKCFGDSCNIKTSKQILHERKIKDLTPEQKIFLECMGVEKFLQTQNN